jgi:hypothetical protein
MNHVPQDELFSAYLDGELTAAERAHVEQLLAGDPAARRLLDELRALSTTLHGLPQQKVGEDLSRRVLQAAERRMLTGADDRPTPSTSREPSIWREISWRGMFSRRALLWTGLALVIAVAFMLKDQGRQAPRGPAQIAMNEKQKTEPAPTADKPAGPPPSISAPGWKPEVAKVEKGKKDEKLGEKSEGGPKKSEREDIAQKAPAEAGGGKQIAAAQRDAKLQAAPSAASGQSAGDDRVAQGKALPSVPGPEKMAAPLVDAGKAGGPPVADQPHQEEGPREGVAPAGKMAAAARAMMRMAAPLVAKPAESKDSPQPALDKYAAKEAPTEPAKTIEAEKPNELVPQAQPAVRGLATMPPVPSFAQPRSAAAGPMVSAASPRGDAAAQSADGVMVVLCDISPEAAEKRLFDDVLARNGIAWDQKKSGEIDARLTEKLAQTLQEASDLAKQKKQPAAEAIADSVAQNEGAVGAVGAEAGPLDVVYVQAPPAQVQTVLAQLAKQSDDFPSVSIQPAPGGPSRRGGGAAVGGLSAPPMGAALAGRSMGDSRMSQGQTGSRPVSAIDGLVRPGIDRPVQLGQGLARRLPTPAGGAIEQQARQFPSLAPSQKPPSTGAFPRPLMEGMAGEKAQPKQPRTEATPEQLSGGQAKPPSVRSPERIAIKKGAGAGKSKRAKPTPNAQLQAKTQQAAAQQVLFVLRITGRDAATGRASPPKAGAGK